MAFAEDQSKKNVWWLCWFGEWSLVVPRVCDPELDALMGVSSSLLVAVLMRCSALCLSSVLTSVKPVLGQNFFRPSCPSLASVALGLCFLFFSL